MKGALYHFSTAAGPSLGRLQTLQCLHERAWDRSQINFREGTKIRVFRGDNKLTRDRVHHTVMVIESEL